MANSPGSMPFEHWNLIEHGCEQQIKEKNDETL